jgi:hypothetical protein
MIAQFFSGDDIEYIFGMRYQNNTLRVRSTPREVEDRGMRPPAESLDITRKEQIGAS